MNENIFEEVKTIVSDLFSVNSESLTLDSSPDTIEAWDSLQHVNVVLDVERQFNIHLDPEEIEQMKSLQAIVDIVVQKVGSQ